MNLGFGRNMLRQEEQACEESQLAST